MTWRMLAVLAVVVASTAQAEDAAQKKAREELERELKQMVGTSPTRVRVDFVSPDEPNYKLEEAVFEVDGKAVPSQSLEVLASEGLHTVFTGDVAPGKHKVTARVVFANGTSVVLSDEGGHKWKLAGDASFEVPTGLEVQVQIVPSRDSTQKDISKRFALRMPATPVMVAKLDDGKMPEPPPKTALAAQAEAVAVAVAVAAAAPAPAPAAAAAAAPTPVATKEPEAVAQVDKQPNERPTPDDAPARRPEPNAPTAPQGIAVGEPNPSAPAPAPPSSAPVAAAEDAGLPHVASAAAEAAAPVGNLVWLVGGSGLVALILLVLLARRRSRVPTVRD